MCKDFLDRGRKHRHGDQAEALETLTELAGGRAEIVDAARAIAYEAAAGRLDPAKLTEERFRRFLDEPGIPDVDLFVRSSGEQRTSNFLLWQSAYAELVFLDRLWPDFDRRDLWRAIELYADRDRRYGGAVPNEVGPPGP